MPYFSWNSSKNQKLFKSMECKIDQYSQRVANSSENFPMQPNHKERLENRRKYLNINLIDKCFPSKDLWKDFICFLKNLL